MKSFPSLVLGLSALLPFSAWAGPLYGTVRMGNAPADRIAITVACPNFSRPGQPPTPVTARGVSDSRGSFSLRVEATGRCEMQLQRDGRVGAAFEVLVSSNPARFDFEIDAALNRVRR